MKRLTYIDVFNRSSESEWAAPTFIKSKKAGGVRILTYFRRLNAQIKRKPIPLPNTSDILRKLSGFKYATAIDGFRSSSTVKDKDFLFLKKIFLKLCDLLDKPPIPGNLP
jgi:hypothetical protein